MREPTYSFDKANVYRGVRAPDALAEKHREVFNHTLGFDLRFNSLADARDGVTATDDYTQ